MCGTMKKILLLLVAAAVAVGCNKDVAPRVGDSMVELSVAVSLDQGAESKVTLSEDGAAYNVEWSAGDELGAWWSDATAFTQFTMSSSLADDSQVAVFSGEVASDVVSLYFIHPYIAAAEVSEGKFTVDLSSQSVSAGGDLSHLGSTTYMISEAVAVEDMSEESASPTMKHIGAIMDLRIQCTAAAGYELIAVSVSGSTLPSLAQIDIAAGIEGDGFYTSEIGEISIEVPNFAAGDNNIFPTVPFNIIPFDITTDDTIEVEATFVDAAGNYYIGTREITGAVGSFERATRNTLNVIISELSRVITITPELLGTSANGTLAYFESNEALFEAYDAYSNTYSGVTYILLKAGGGYICNKTQLKGLSHIVIAYNNDIRPTVYGSATSDFSESDQITAVECTLGYAYSFEDDHKYFKVTRENTSSNAQILSMDIYYNQLGDSPSILTSLSEEFIEFEGSGGSDSSETIYVYGYNIESATVEIVNNNENNFSVSELDSEDCSFTVSPKNENSSGENYTATITVTIGEVSKTLDVTQKYTGAVDTYYVLVEEDQEDWSGTYILSCVKSDITYIVTGEGSSSGTLGVTTYDTAEDGKFKSNATLDSYAVTITKSETVTDDGAVCYDVQLNDGTYIGHSSSTTISFSTTSAAYWNILKHETYGYIIYSVADSSRAIALYNGLTYFKAYRPSSTYMPVNLYKLPEISEVE